MLRTPYARSGARGQVRIIGGSHRRRILRFPQVEGLRPTPDRVRETLFNWLGQDLTGLSCLDAFAGSGALGFEAASRGARRVVMLEAARPACEALRTNAVQLGFAAVEIDCVEAIGWLRQSAEKFDLIFLDPPFDAGLVPRALELAGARLNLGGRVYVEEAAPLQPSPFWNILRQGDAGRSHFALLERTPC